MKSSRHNKIMEIVNNRVIETQNQLMDALAEEGLQSTQATVSRDIKELRLVKEQTQDGRYHYVAAGRDEVADYDKRLRKIFRESVTSYATAQNLIVIKTLPGLAPAVASAVDGMNTPKLVGTIAGDDTVFIAMQDHEAAVEFCDEIGLML